MIMATACGFGDMYDDDHARLCLVCSNARWREHRQRHPGLLRRWLRRLLGEPKGYPLPPPEPDVVTTECCCGDPRSHTETMGGCSNCFVGAHDACERPVKVDSRGIIVSRTETPMG